LSWRHIGVCLLVKNQLKHTNVYRSEISLTDTFVLKTKTLSYLLLLSKV
jgi:hypothetical protein